NAWLTIPLGLLWLGNGFTLINFLWQRAYHPEMIPPTFTNLSEGTVGILIFWWIYNLIILTLAILACIDVPKPESYHWFRWEKPVQLGWQNHQIMGKTELVSEQGVRVQLEDNLPWPLALGQWVDCEIQTHEWPGSLKVKATVINMAENSDHGSIKTIDLQFVAVTPPQYRHLVQLLFCRPGQWVRRSHPNEWQTLLVLAKGLWRPRFLGQDDPGMDAIPIR
ncbi:MAG: PilZ domain-containing protein, partial [Synechocystis sp.]|nr:PilZ domain-containing protein [Synechocystis sp.]